LTSAGSGLRMNFEYMPLRIGTSLLVCFAVLAGSSLGLNRGMVICIDGDGHLALESAHAQHARCHEEDSDHHPHEYPAESEHGELHSALDACFDAAIAKFNFRCVSAPRLHPSGFPIAPYLILPDLQQASVPPHSRRADSTSGGIPRPEIACLSTVVLIV
jgi:hypothetical protein